jgi:hypothetical protein
VAEAAGWLWTAESKHTYTAGTEAFFDVVIIRELLRAVNEDPPFSQAPIEFLCRETLDQQHRAGTVIKIRLANRFPKIAAEFRQSAEHRRNRRRWVFLSHRQNRWADFSSWAQRMAGALAKRPWTFKGVAAILFVTAIFLTVYSDVTSPQLNVKSYKLAGGPPGLDEKTFTELVAQTLAEIRTRNENTAPNSDFLMFGRQLDFHVLASEGFSYQPFVHDIEHGFHWEPPEITGQAIITKDKKAFP